MFYFQLKAQIKFKMKKIKKLIFVLKMCNILYKKFNDYFIFKILIKKN